jgi:quercetin dioxygenase-like cupin family protein
MIEKIYKLSTGDKTVVEKLIMGEDLNFIHMVFEKEKGLAPHYANATVHMTVLRGRLSITLEEQETAIYERGNMIVIPYNTKMHVRNEHDEVLELIVVKAPGAKHPVEYC